MWKGIRFSNWNGEQFVSIWKITDLVAQLNNRVHSGFTVNESESDIGSMQKMVASKY